MNVSRSNSTPNNNIRSSPPRINKNIKNRGRDHSLTPKKVKNQKKDSKKDVPDPIPPATAEENKAPSPESSVNPLIGPDLKEVVISRVFCSSINKSGDIVSPPPSSLPLPTFSLRSKDRESEVRLVHFLRRCNDLVILVGS
ncbi:hypothetical protein L1987_79067 [Smallanthus sonchifolius]|uniref:Uncharacterized protein n=1 Tax=Smallanthus sonchifolius TaxID=185202 RepID=A0ACB8ZEM6_9ASTR|nr:hypothetical protein L1987_79067 [Smallanthus sonchifolius]